MSKLWIVHRNPRRLDALARLSGLAAPDLVCGAPSGEEFVSLAGSSAAASTPAAILIGIEGDFELELDFLHRHRDLLEGAKRKLLTAPENVEEVQRLFGASSDEVVGALPSPRDLRSFVLSAVAHRNAETLAERRDRSRIAHRFATWFGDLEIPGLLRALDPALSRLPLLVRGVPGSGRTLLARYVELFRVREAAGPTLRVDAREIPNVEELVSRLRARENAGLPSVRSIWIDEIDALDLSTQRAIAEWIRLDASPVDAVGCGLRWIATAGPTDLTDKLDADLERAFAPLSLLVPSLADHPEALAPFVRQVALDWTALVGGVSRQMGASAIQALEAHAWSGDRAAVEAELRSSLAATAQDPLEESHLVSSQARFGPEPGVESATWADLSPESEIAPSADEVDFVDVMPPADAFEPQPLPTEPEPTVPDATVEEFEQAFLDGLPAAGPSGLPDLSATRSSAPPADISSEMGEASFHLADPAAGPVDAPETDATVSAQAAGAVQAAGAAQAAGVVLAAGATPAAGASGPAPSGWRRLARSLSHEIRNPLVSIRTFAELLPEHFADESFRARFTELVGRDVAHIDEVISRLASAAEREKLETSPVDVSELIEKLLDERREQIGQGRLLVLRELERDAPIAWADAHALEIALAGLLDRALASLPERGDLFVATRRIERAADGDPRLRVLLRHHNPELGASDGSGLEELGSAANVLEYVLAETIVETHGGTLTIDSTDAQETLILVDLRTPA